MKTKKATYDTADDFLKEKNLYQLGMLPTETPHPKTQTLSKWVNEDLVRAIRTVREIDLETLKVLSSCAKEFLPLERSIRETLARGNKIFLGGCGATGRLSLALESLYRTTHAKTAHENSVVGFMAGGDIALVRSVENFEDIPEFGARHLETLGFKNGDLLISSTEGGETPYVIGATEAAARTSNHPKPYFIYCNPTEILKEHVERSRAVFENPSIEKISIPIGPMALSGSTRLQASTVLMLGIGICLLMSPRTEEDFKNGVQAFAELIQRTSFDFLQPFIAKEADIIKRGDFMLYSTDRYGITILTDTTERSPTFSLKPFENQLEKDMKPSWSYLTIDGAKDSASAWTAILGREPYGLDWPEYSDRLGKAMALGFDFSAHARAHRESLVKPKSVAEFSIKDVETGILFQLEGYNHFLDLKDSSLLYRHLLLKLILNIHSLLVMGRLGRYEHNVMTWVRPSNGKLIDRAIRYARYLLEKRSIHPSYEEVARALFDLNAKLGPDEAIVVKLVEHFAND